MGVAAVLDDDSWPIATWSRNTYIIYVHILMYITNFAFAFQDLVIFGVSRLRIFCLKPGIRGAKVEELIIYCFLFRKTFRKSGWIQKLDNWQDAGQDLRILLVSSHFSQGWVASILVPAESAAAEAMEMLKYHGCCLCHRNLDATAGNCSTTRWAVAWCN